MLSFLIPFVILEIIKPILKISPKITFHNAITTIDGDFSDGFGGKKQLKTAEK